MTRQFKWLLDRCVTETLEKKEACLECCEGLLSVFSAFLFTSFSSSFTKWILISYANVLTETINH